MLNLKFQFIHKNDLIYFNIINFYLKYRFAVITMGTANYLPEDDETQFDLSTSNCFQPWLGIDHTNKAANKAKSRYSTMEKAIKIFN